MGVVIKVENLSKQYRLGAIGTGTLSHDINRWWHKVRGKEDPYLKVSQVNDRVQKATSDYVWALHDINFDIRQGEVVGVIGRNGAGKSTLLKILSRTTLPTTGSVKVRGRIASLLEVGTGFHPELTGRENVFLNGAILGMRKSEIKSKFDAIVDFAGVEKYIDTPVKRYSSGMYVRLAFAVAAHLDPEILIVDEVLAVGDAEFQKKALGKMKDVSKGEGKTVFFVSHNISAIRQLCTSGILLKAGRMETKGHVDEVIKNYFNLGLQTNEKLPVKPYRVYDTKDSPVIIEDIYTIGTNSFFPTYAIGEEPEIGIRITVKNKIERANLTISFFNAEGVKVGMAFSWDDNFILNADSGTHEIVFRLRNPTFSPGQYFIGVAINQTTHTVAWDGIGYYPIFKIDNQNNTMYFTDRSWGINHLQANSWLINPINYAE
jgi:lipopolysaccharide transport system ATP-binding protein